MNIIVFDCPGSYVPDRVKLALRKLAQQRGWGDVNIVTTCSHRPTDRGPGVAYAMRRRDLPDDRWRQLLRSFRGIPLLVFDQPAERVYEVTADAQRVVINPVMDT